MGKFFPTLLLRIFCQIALKTSRLWQSINQLQNLVLYRIGPCCIVD